MYCILLRRMFVTDFLYQCYSNSETPKNWVFFLHGYNNTNEEMSQIYFKLLNKIKNLGIIAPEGKCVSAKDNSRKSWYKISGFDVDGKRLQESTSVEEIVSIYNKAGDVLADTSDNLNSFLDNIQKQYNFTDSNTYIAGFSQGAMLAIWTALSRKNKVKGCFSFSGLVAANKYLDGKIRSYPEVYFLHGKKDKQVQFKCLNFSLKTLQEKQIKATSLEFEDLAHEISDEQIECIAKIIK